MLSRHTNIHKSIQHAVWDYVVSRGFLALIAGLFLVIWPGAATLAVCIVIGIFLLINGFSALFKSMHSDFRRTSFLIYGLVCLLAGILVLLNPLLLERLFIWIFAFWVLIAGINQLYTAVKAKDAPGSARTLSAVTGAISLAVGLGLVFNPDLGLKIIIMIIGIYFLVFGVLAISIGTLLHRNSKRNSI